MSDGRSDAEGEWDDMAIVRAFEDALSDQRHRAEKKPKAKQQRQERRRAPSYRETESQFDSEEDYTHVNSAHASNGLNKKAEQSPARVPRYPTSGGAAAATPSTAAYPDDVYQAAYAHAFAQLQAQYQPHQPVQPPSWSKMPQTGFMPTPSMMPMPGQPPMNAPWAMPPTGYSPQPPHLPHGASDDALASLLLSWYQSGYYMGRYQAMREMRGAPHHM